MSKLERKIDFAALITVDMANCNGDPLNGNRPRVDFNGRGEISDVCIKRKIRNRMQDLGYPIFVQSEDRCDDGMDSLSKRANAALKGLKSKQEYAEGNGWMSVPLGRCSLSRAIKRTATAYPWACAAPSPSIRLSACRPWTC